MDGLNKVLRIDAEAMTMAAQAGVQLVDAAAPLRKLNLQFMLNIEIGTSRSAPRCAATRESPSTAWTGSGQCLPPRGQWVSPPVRSRRRQPTGIPSCHHSFARITPVGYRRRSHVPAEAARSGEIELRRPRRGRAYVGSGEQTLTMNQTMGCWTLKEKIVFQTRNAGTELRHEWLGNAR